MDRIEKVLYVPACFVTRETSYRVAARLYAIALENAEVELKSRMREEYQKHPEANPPLLRLMEEGKDLERALDVIAKAVRPYAPRSDRTTVISSESAFQYVGRDAPYDELPKDLVRISLEIPGHSRYVSVLLTNDLEKDFPLHRANKVIIQGSDGAWVNQLYQDLKVEFDQSKKTCRDLAYRYFRPLALLATILLSLTAFRLYQFAEPGFTLQTPLTGVSLLGAVVVVLVINQCVFTVGGRFLQTVFPYFEFEGRLSERRMDARKLWRATLLATYGGGAFVALGKRFWAFLSSLFE